MKHLFTIIVFSLGMMFSTASQPQSGGGGVVLPEEIMISGSWYDAVNPGYGIIVDTDGDSSTVWFFGYDQLGGEKNQAWYITGGYDEALGAFPLYRPSGFFPAIDFELGDVVGYMMTTVINPNLIEVRWDFYTGRCLGFSPQSPECHGSTLMTPIYRNSIPE